MPAIWIAAVFCLAYQTPRKLYLKEQPQLWQHRITARQSRDSPPFSRSSLITSEPSATSALSIPGHNGRLGPSRLTGVRWL